MASERQKLFPTRAALPSRDLDWQSLECLDGDGLDTHCRQSPVKPGKMHGMLGTIFRKAQNRATMHSGVSAICIFGIVQAVPKVFGSFGWDTPTKAWAISTTRSRRA
jgi:hypothetical protein